MPHTRAHAHTHTSIYLYIQHILKSRTYENDHEDDYCSQKSGPNILKYPPLNGMGEYDKVNF